MTTRSGCLLLLLHFAFFGTIVCPSGEAANGRRDRSSLIDAGGSAHRFVDSGAAATSNAGYRWQNTQQQQHQQQQQQQQILWQQHQQSPQLVKTYGDRPAGNIGSLDSIFEFGPNKTGFKLFNTTRDADPIIPSFIYASSSDHNRNSHDSSSRDNNHHDNHNSMQSDQSSAQPHSEQPFKVQRTPDGRLNLVFNDFLFSQKEIGGQATQRPPTGDRAIVAEDTLVIGNQPVRCEKGGGKPFCEKVLNYPDQAQLDSILQQDIAKFEVFFGVEDVVPVSFKERSGIVNELEVENFCRSSPNIIYPQAAETKNSNYLLIVNHYKQYKQGVRVEECSNEGAVCDAFNSLPHGYKTWCKQYYSYRPLVAILNGTVVREFFKLPSCCKCVYTIDPNITMP